VCITNFRTSEADLLFLLDEVRRAGVEMGRERGGGEVTR
jgi:hypothetical protein